MSQPEDDLDLRYPISDDPRETFNLKELIDLKWEDPVPVSKQGSDEIEFYLVTENYLPVDRDGPHRVQLKLEETITNAAGGTAVIRALNTDGSDETLVYAKQSQIDRTGQLDDEFHLIRIISDHREKLDEDERNDVSMVKLYTMLPDLYEVKLYSEDQSPPRNERNLHLMILENVKGMTLLRHVEILKREDPEAEDMIKWREEVFKTILWTVISLIKNVQFLHQHGISHGDIHGENVFLNRDNGSTTLIDFGLSSDLAKLTVEQANRSKFVDVLDVCLCVWDMLSLLSPEFHSPENQRVSSPKTGNSDEENRSYLKQVWSEARDMYEKLIPTLTENTHYHSVGNRLYEMLAGITDGIDLMRALEFFDDVKNSVGGVVGYAPYSKS